jgi:hypothetical protein
MERVFVTSGLDRLFFGEQMGFPGEASARQTSQDINDPKGQLVQKTGSSRTSGG